MRFLFNPNESIGKVKFGMERAEVRSVFPGFKKEFKKSKFSKNTADEFECCHVYYDANNKCNAVELFSTNQLMYENKNLFALNISEFQKFFPDLTEEYGSYCSKKYSVGVTFEEGKVESILVGCKDYYI